MEGVEGLGLKGRSLFVCGFGDHWPILLIFSLTPQPVFSVGSSTTDTATVEPPTPSIKPNRFDTRLGVPLISVSALLLALLLAVGILKLLSLRYRCRKSNRVVEEGGETGGAAGAGMGCWKDEEGGEMAAAPVVRECNSQDIRRMTGEYGEMIGAGGFSKVYLGRFSSEAAVGSGLAAVKVHNASERLNMAFKQELDILLHVRHDNIVKLIGFCDDEKEGALVFEYVPNGNLQERLHGHGNGGVVEMNSVLSWGNRMVITYQLAQAIEYLHEKCSPQIIHGDVKASNVLLDGALNCKLCDFGSAKMGFSSLVLPPSSSNSLRTKQIMMGSPGYTDPHYLITGVASKKNDIYSFGVLLLELIMGMEAFCSNRGQLVTSVATTLLRDDCSGFTQEMLDPRLKGKFNLEEAKAMVSLSRSCLKQSPTLRPSATQIVEAIREKVPSALFSTPSAEKAV